MPEGDHRELTDDQIDELTREAELGYDTATGRPVAQILLTTADPEVWARTFKDQFGDTAPDVVTMRTWFASAIETGRARRWQAEEDESLEAQARGEAVVFDGDDPTDVARWLVDGSSN
jgi:hypothetical protein